MRGTGKFLLPLLLAACAQPPPQVPTETTAPPLPERIYRQAGKKGEAVYRVDPQQSRVFMHTGRDGPMKAAGHDHVIASVDVEGLVLLSDDPAKSRADLRLPLQKLVVDDPVYRERFGLEPELPASAVEGTKRNLQDKVLESSLFPWAAVSIRVLSMQEMQADLDVSVTVHGTTFGYRVPAVLEVEAGTLGVSGSMTVSHADFGLAPFSAAGGLLRVAEDVDVVFDLVALTTEW